MQSIDMKAWLFAIAVIVLVSSAAAAQSPRGIAVTLTPLTGVTIDCGLQNPRFPYNVVIPKLITHWNPLSIGNSYIQSVGNQYIADYTNEWVASSSYGLPLQIRQWQHKWPLVFEPRARYLWVYNGSGSDTYTIYLIAEY
jgi:hypothetical protein